MLKVIIIIVWSNVYESFFDTYDMLVYLDRINKKKRNILCDFSQRASESAFLLQKSGVPLNLWETIDQVILFAKQYI